MEPIFTIENLRYKICYKIYSKRLNENFNHKGPSGPFLLSEYQKLMEQVACGELIAVPNAGYEYIVEEPAKLAEPVIESTLENSFDTLQKHQKKLL